MQRAVLRLLCAEQRAHEQRDGAHQQQDPRPSFMQQTEPASQQYRVAGRPHATTSKRPMAIPTTPHTCTHMRAYRLAMRAATSAAALVGRPLAARKPRCETHSMNRMCQLPNGMPAERSGYTIPPPCPPSP